MSDKGKGKEKQASTAAAGSSTASISKSPSATSPAAAATTSAGTGTAAGPPLHTKGDWTAVWNADVGKYYYWNRTTNTTTWTNPFESGAAAPAAPAVASGSASPGPAAEASASTSKATSPQPGQASNAAAKDPLSATSPINEERAASSGPTAAEFGGIDPDLAYLDPSLASRAKGAGGAGAYVARFNARTGKFEADPTKTPDRVSDVQRAKRQNQFYFDYDGWQATLAQQQEQDSLKRANGDVDDEANKKHRPSKKEMEAIRMRNKEKKDKKQKGWLLN